MPCDHCGPGVDRRDFLLQMAALLGAGGLVACSADIVTLPTIVKFTVVIAQHPSLANPGGIALVDDGSRTATPIAVSRIDANTFLALSLICPHQGVTVNIAGAAFSCPGHGATFSVNGTWTGGQNTSNLGRYPVVYDAAEGTLLIG